MIQILIVDDQAVVQAGLAVIIGSYPEIEVVGQASGGVDCGAGVADRVGGLQLAMLILHTTGR